MCCNCDGDVCSAAAFAAAQAVNNPPSESLERTSRGNAKRAYAVYARNGPSAIPNDFAESETGARLSLNVDVYGESELSGNVRVDNDGNITFPFLGKIHVAGDSLPEAQKQNSKAIS